MVAVLKGKPVADKLTGQLIEETCQLKQKGIIPGLKIVRVGSRPDDIAYEKGALSRCNKVGINADVVEFPETVSQEQLIGTIMDLNSDSSVHGVLLFRPLPKHIDELVVRRALTPDKDVDCMNPLNEGKLYEGDPSGFPPCTPTAVIEMLDYYGIEAKGKNTVILGASKVVGKPLAVMLLDKRATISVCHSQTKDRALYMKQADLVISAVGKANMVKADQLKPEAVVIDVGINACEGGICGDVDYEDVLSCASAVTPVPGGVGAITSTIIAKHVIKACKQITGT